MKHVIVNVVKVTVVGVKNHVNSQRTSKLFQISLLNDRNHTFQETLL